MNAEFTLRNVVDFLEANGFHVREAREIEKNRIIYSFNNGKKKPPMREIRAICVEIAPEARA